MHFVYIFQSHVQSLMHFSRLPFPFTDSSLFSLSYKLGAEELFFIVPLIIHKLAFALILAVPFLISKKYSLAEYCSLYLHAVYANCITYGKFTSHPLS